MIKEGEESVGRVAIASERIYEDAQIADNFQGYCNVFVDGVPDFQVRILQRSHDRKQVNGHNFHQSTLDKSALAPPVFQFFLVGRKLSYVDIMPTPAQTISSQYQLQQEESLQKHQQEQQQQQEQLQKQHQADYKFSFSFASLLNFNSGSENRSVLQEKVSVFVIDHIISVRKCTQKEEQLVLEAMGKRRIIEKEMFSYKLTVVVNKEAPASSYYGGAPASGTSYSKKARLWDYKTLVISYRTAQEEETHRKMIESELIKQTMRPKRLHVIINPVGGKKQGRMVYSKIIQPIFSAAGIDVDISETTDVGHAREIAKRLDLYQLDGVVSVGGDGTASEIVHGLIENRNWASGRKIPIGLVPAGSTDTIIYSAIGCNDRTTVALQIVLGNVLEMDVAEVSQENVVKKYALSLIGFGFYGDVIRKSEGLRTLGPMRYDLAGFRAFVQLQAYSGTVRFLPANLSTTCSSIYSANNFGSVHSSSSSSAMPQVSSSSTLSLSSSASFSHLPPSSTSSRTAASLSRLHLQSGNNATPAINTNLKDMACGMDCQICAARNVNGSGVDSYLLLPSESNASVESVPTGFVSSLSVPAVSTTTATTITTTTTTTAAAAAAATTTTASSSSSTSLSTTSASLSSSSSSPALTLTQTPVSLPSSLSHSSTTVSTQKAASTAGALASLLSQPLQPSIQPAMSTSSSISSETFVTIPPAETPWHEITGEFVCVNAANISCMCEKAPRGMSPNAHLSDGCVDLIMVHKCSRLSYLKHLLRLSAGGKDTPGLKSSANKGKLATFTSTEPQETGLIASNSSKSFFDNWFKSNEPREKSKSMSAVDSGNFKSKVEKFVIGTNESSSPVSIPLQPIDSSSNELITQSYSGGDGGLSKQLYGKKLASLNSSNLPTSSSLSVLDQYAHTDSLSSLTAFSNLLESSGADSGIAKERSSGLVDSTHLDLDFIEVVKVTAFEFHPFVKEETNAKFGAWNVDGEMLDGSLPVSVRVLRKEILIFGKKIAI